MLSESITRIDVAYDQLLTASLIGYKKDLSVTDQTNLSMAIDCLKEILDRHQEEEVSSPLTDSDYWQAMSDMPEKLA